MGKRKKALMLIKMLTKAYTGGGGLDEAAAKVMVAEVAKGIGDLNADLAELRRKVEAMRDPDFFVLAPAAVPLAATFAGSRHPELN